MLRKTLLTVFTRTMLGASIVAPIAVHAQLPPPPGGPPPLPGGAPPDLPGGGLAGLSGPGGPLGPGAAGLPRPPAVGGGRPGVHGGQGNVYGRDRAYARNLTATYGYGRLGYADGYGSWRGRYWAPYGVYAYSNSNSSHCEYTYKYSNQLHAYRRVLVCSEE
jgi:hypothetical protein